ncbi:hypothetical protein RMCBS344292_13744 [Rhizopus microsporus]|nr:hypothetical protein RMCBS344292_13744 [Rhizopus microsporus]
MTPISQLRVLRQGDPLSLLMFNLAFKPLLRTTLANNQLRDEPLHLVPVLRNNKQKPCFVPLGPPSSETTSLGSIKVLSYADDLEVFLFHPSEWPYLLDLLSLYGCSSKAKVNLIKTVIMSISGRNQP